MRHKRD